MIKAIVFDFDGVIVESADIKTEAFAELFSDYPKKVKEIVDYHLANAGISRYVKFRYIYKQILGEELPRDKEIELGRAFSQIVLQKVLQAPFVPGAKEFLKKGRNRYFFFIASGTPEDELFNIIYARGLSKYFKEIHGSPKKKADIIKRIIDKYDFIRDEVVYVGDAQSDQDAAEETGVFFIKRKANSDLRLKGRSWLISDLFELDNILNKING